MLSYISQVPGNSTLIMSEQQTEAAISAKNAKLNPVSAFSDSESSTQDELIKVCFSYPSEPRDADEKDSMGENPIPKETPVSSMPSSVSSYRFDGSVIKLSVTNTSREGRAMQRWDRCPDTDRLIRLTTGCVPITNDGRIMFCSSAKKKEWILPKGGWELDEEMEVSAVREAYEEAGVLGVLGPKLSDLTYETRKEKLRRMGSSSLSTGTKVPKSPPGKHALVRVSFFPLYISDVLEDWPESGRTRKVLSIEEALETIQRQELKDVITEVRDKKLHIFNRKKPVRSGVYGKSSEVGVEA